MLQNMAWHAIDGLTRAQLAMFHALSDDAQLSQDARQRALVLDDSGWLAWMGFMANGPLPASPPLPEMLQRLALVTFELVAAVERGIDATR